VTASISRSNKKKSEVGDNGLKKESILEGKYDVLDWKYWKNPENYDERLPLFKVALTEWACDNDFKREFEEDPQGALDRKGWGDIKASELQIMTDPVLAAQYKSSMDETPILIKQYRNFITAKKKHAIEIRNTKPQHEKWKTWRERMVKSTFWREGYIKHARLVHAPFTIELTQGCTVGCWFCGVDAEKFQKPVELSAAKKELFEEIIESFKTIAGEEAAQHGFLYWATDPLDHPDYEWFLRSFYQKLKYWPQTTTAQGMKHAARLKKLFADTSDLNSFVQRFSMIKKKDLKDIREYFTPEELFLCEQIAQFDNEISPKATAGRTRKIAMKKVKEGKKVGFRYNLEETGSIACVSGFLLNMVDQSIKLITPCLATDQWPLGYRILGQEVLENGKVNETINKLLENSINANLNPSDVIKIQRGIEVTAPEETKLAFTKYGHTVLLHNIAKASEVAEALRGKDKTLIEICGIMSANEVSNIDTMIMLYKIRELGILDESVN
jgi:radical SAM family RiPP maturation amino acid epimerase